MHRISLLLIVLLTLLFISCKKDVKPCDIPTELNDHNHLVDLSALKGAPELLDTLAKYPQLQVYRVINDEYAYGIHCNIFHQGLVLFYDGYALYKSKKFNDIIELDSIKPDINIPLIPSITSDEAIAIAKQKINYSGYCIYYRLGIYDINTMESFRPKNYKLVWNIKKADDSACTIVDANTGEVYYYYQRPESVE